jgi:hypothetical protein
LLISAEENPNGPLIEPQQDREQSSSTIDRMENSGLWIEDR